MLDLGSTANTAAGWDCCLQALAEHLEDAHDRAADAWRSAPSCDERRRSEEELVAHYRALLLPGIGT